MMLQSNTINMNHNSIKVSNDPHCHILLCSYKCNLNYYYFHFME